VGGQCDGQGESNPLVLLCRREVLQIRVRGHLDSKWSDWLEGMEVKLLDNGEMILSGTIVDQPP